MIVKLNDAEIDDNELLLFGVRYRQGDEGDDLTRVFTYAALKAGGLWYMTGTGQVPQAAGWGAVQRWLDNPRRELVWVRRVTQTDLLWASRAGDEVRPPLYAVAPGEGVVDLAPDRDESLARHPSRNPDTLRPYVLSEDEAAAMELTAGEAASYRRQMADADEDPVVRTAYEEATWD